MKKFLISVGLVASVTLMASCAYTEKSPAQDFEPWVESQVKVFDQGHGPDLGSDEWCGAVEFKLFNGKSGLKPCSPEWKQKVTETLNK
ncbi:MAG: hypothetical protein ACRCWR_01770 [Saezia sp.]